MKKMNSTEAPTIFIVEDNRFYGEIIKEELEQNNYTQAELYTSGDDCIANLYKMPNIILLDYYLDGSMNGVETLKKIKAFNPDIQVIMLSAQRELNIAIKALKYGALDYVVKNNRSFKQLRLLLKKINKWNDMLVRKRRRRQDRVVLGIGVGLSIVLLALLKSFVFA